MLRLHSNLLEDDIVCLEDGEKSPREPEGVVYVRSELEAMKGLSAEQRKAVHRTKKYFGGRFVGQAPPAN